MWKKGTAYLLAGSRRYVLHEGDEVFINSKVIHRLECEGSTIIPNIVFSPSLLLPEGSLIYEKYIGPVISSTNECMVFTQENSTEQQIVQLMKEVFALQSENDNEIKTVSALLDLWRLICYLAFAARKRVFTPKYYSVGSEPKIRKPRFSGDFPLFRPCAFDLVCQVFKSYAFLFYIFYLHSVQDMI